MNKRTLAAWILTALLLLLGCTAALAETEKTTVQFYFPIQLGGAAAELIESLVAEFEELNPDIDVDAVFCGSYGNTLTKLTLALEGGEAPQLVILANGNLFTLYSMDALHCLDEYIVEEGGDEFINDFYPAFMASCLYDGSYYAMPFQRSVLAMFYNKEHFADAGLDPSNPPKTWAELLDAGAKLSKKKEDGTVDRWGVMISNNSTWTQQAMTISASAEAANIYSNTGTEVYFDTDEVKKTVQFYLDLQNAGASPMGVIEEGMLPTNFIEGVASMVAISSGNLSNIAQNAAFDYDVCLMPAMASDVGASIAGGGNMFMIEAPSTTPEQYDAAWKFMRFMTDTDVQARWSVGTGYIAARVSSRESETMAAYFEKVPQAEMMYEQLENSYGELRVYANSQVSALFKNLFASVALGESTIDEAAAYAQSEAEYILEDYK